MKIYITGAPAAGKTTLANCFKVEPHCTDDFVDLEWDEQSDLVKNWIDESKVKLIEGVVLPRALRKWLDENDSGKPCDTLIYMDNPKVKLSRGQERMAQSIRTVMDEICLDLQRRGVDVIGFGQDDSDEIHVF